MTNETNKLSKLFVACWKNPDLKARFKASPLKVLAEYGMDVSEGIDVCVVENMEDSVHITIPVAPAQCKELTLAELETIASGAIDDGSEEGATWPMPKFRFTVDQ